MPHEQPAPATARELLARLIASADEAIRGWRASIIERITANRPTDYPSQNSLAPGTNIRCERMACGLTQEQLAEKADITARYLQQLEATEFGASLAVLIRLRRALDCRWDTLLDGIE